MTKQLSMAPGRLWFDSVDPGLSETNIDQFNWWLNTSTGKYFICIDNTIGSQAWEQCVVQGVDFACGNLTIDGGVHVNLTTPGAYPYTSLASDHVILVDSAQARTINLIASPLNGQIYYIKDNVGSAASNNITISGNGKNIDGAASSTINTNYGSKKLVYNGTQWNVL